jgi:diguanylate cyclase (GGDEF)-like protein
LDVQPNKNTLENEEYQPPQVVSFFALVGFVITGLMGGIALVNQTYILATTLLFVSCVFFIAFYVFNKYHNIALSSAISLYSLSFLMLYLVFTGGVENTGPLWIYVVPPVSLFFHGLKRGLVETILFIAACAVIMFVPTDFVPHAQYSLEFKLRLIYSFLTVTFLSALYEYSRDRAYHYTLELSQKYQQLAHMDSLTQLSNRRDALSILKREQSRAIRSKEALSVILCDVDYFKKINDLYGHNAGDAVLIELAKIFTQNIREQDCVARWGGEEFLFILPGTLAENAYQLAEKIQRNVQNNFVDFEGESISVTVSMGIEQSNGNRTIDEIVNSADKYLYQAKNSGRNKIYPKY